MPPSHRGGRPRRRIGLAALVLALVSVALLGSQGTGAYWTSSRVLPVSQLTSDNLDVRLNGTTGDDVTVTDLAIADMLPGDSRAGTVMVTNASGITALRLTIAAKAGGGLAESLRLQVYRGGAASNTGSSATGYAGTCSGSEIVPATPLSNSDVTVYSVAQSDGAAPLVAGGAQTLCFRVRLVPSAPAAAQGLSTSATVTITGRSVSTS